MPNEDMRDQFHAFVAETNRRDGLVEGQMTANSKQIESNTSHIEENRKNHTAFIGSFWVKIISIGLAFMGGLLALIKFVLDVAPAAPL